MPYFVVDDGADSHPKMIRAKNAAVGLWTRVGSYVARQLTDGHVPGEVAKMYGSTPQIRRLVEVRLWHEHGHTCPRCPAVREGDYYMHDYAESGNPSRAEVLARREKAAEKKRQQRGAPKRPRPAAQAPFDFSDEEPPAEEEPPPPAPPRPEPIAADWAPSAEDVHAAQVARTDVGRAPLTADELDAVTRKFVRRMSDDQVRAAGFGGRWRQWAENERPNQPQSGGGVVVHLPAGRASGPPMSTADRRAAEAFALSQRLRAEGNQ
ncbi:hypothetical protein ACLQ2N_08375 [Streptomyces sp. DT224]|uniref:hypothetical protein n=1 Tax=Streptomyces sp. DT224 TaxID=3393426 RepID=UPI003CEECE42